MAESLVLRSFAGGELAPGLYARADLARYVTSARTIRNFLVRRHGGAANRPGFKYVGTVKTSADRTSLRPFHFKAADRSFAIECGSGYFRFIRNGAYVTVSGVAAWSNVTAYVPGDLVESGGVNYYCHTANTNQVPPDTNFWHALTGAIYEIPSPYTAAEFYGDARIKWEQQGLVVSITSLEKQPRELTYTSLTRWVLTTVTTAPSQAPPTTPLGVAGSVGTKTFNYVITAAKVDTYEESIPSSVLSIPTAGDPTDTAPHALSWTAPTLTPAEYYVYSDGGFGNGTYGFIGTATGQVTFNDVGQVPDFSLTPPVPKALFGTTFNFPYASATYQQRRWYASTHNNRELVHASQVGFSKNFQIRSPLQEDDAIQFTVASRFINPIHHLVGMKFGLVLLTDCGELVVRGDEQGVVKPTAINLEPHSYNGADFCPPQVLGNVLLYVQIGSKIVRDLQFDERVDGVGGRDLTLMSSHLFRTNTLDTIGLSQVPDSILWAVRNDGTLLGCTYVREEDVLAWHRHDTGDGDTFEDVCVIPEAAGDAVYVAVNRGGVRMVERLASRDYAAIADAFFVDSGITYSGVSTTSITGLSHLEGRQVMAFCGGTTVQGPYTVSGGAITLGTATTKAQVGLAIECDLETLDLDVGGSDVRDRKKRVARLALLLEASFRGFQMGPDEEGLLPSTVPEWESATTAFTGRHEEHLSGRYGDNGRVFIRHNQPTPLTVLGVMPHVEVGG